MKEDPKDKYKCSMDSEVVKRIRKKIGMTQTGVAHALGVSLRAIQSYEQGWREVPTNIMVQLLVLTAAHHPSEVERKPCWEITSCPPERQAQCPCRRTDGSLCWLVSGRMCAGAANSGCHDIQGCLHCPVIKQILN
jgi:DNA-binding transcriptional regulator YiaG